METKPTVVVHTVVHSKATDTPADTPDAPDAADAPDTPDAADAADTSRAKHPTVQQIVTIV